MAGRRLRRLPELKPGLVTGRFVAQVDGPRISAFSPNLEIYLFEADFRGYTQLVKITHEFLHQEPRLPAEILDYNEVRSFPAARDSSCDENWASVSTQLTFDPEGRSTGRRPALVYAHAAPQGMTIENDEVLPCYTVGRVTQKVASRLMRARPARQ